MALSSDAKIQAAMAALEELQSAMAQLTVDRARAKKMPPAPVEAPVEEMEPGDMDMEAEEAPPEGDEEKCPECGMPMSECNCKG
jgi:hypothetical protein